MDSVTAGAQPVENIQTTLVATPHGGYYSVLTSDMKTKHGKCVKMYDSGRVEYTCEYVNGEVHGRYIKYHDLDMPEACGLDSESPIYQIIEYDKGKKHGGYVRYTSEGLLVESQKYVNGLRHVMHYAYAGGKPIYTQYQNGIPTRRIMWSANHSSPECSYEL